jgi:hypothetical protein
VQNSEDTSKGLCIEARADMRITSSLLFMWDIVHNFRNVVSVTVSQKSDFGTVKMENTLFVGQNGK